MSSAICFNLDQSKNMSSSNQLKRKPHDIKQSNQLMYDIIFLFYFLPIKHSIANKMVEDGVDNLLPKTLVEIQFDQLPWGKD